jgi:hypothetical protein
MIILPSSGSSSQGHEKLKHLGPSKRRNYLPTTQHNIPKELDLELVSLLGESVLLTWLTQTRVNVLLFHWLAKVMEQYTDAGRQ